MSTPSSEVGLGAQLLAVFIAGGLGATLRVLLAGWLEPLVVERLPNGGVLLVNLAGCLLIGIAAVALTADHWRTIVMGGLLGGFTTYSAFALFTVTLAQEQRWGVVAGQVALHLLGGVACVLLGMALARVLGLASA